MNERSEEIKRIESEFKIFLKNFYPNKRISEQKDKELSDKLIGIFDYCAYLKKRSESGIFISRKQIYDELFEKLGLRFNENEMKKLIDSMSLTSLLDIYYEGELGDYIVFMNNLVEVAYFSKKDKDLQTIFSCINIPEVMAYNQFLCSKFEEISSFLFKKPFRSTSSIQELLELYKNLCGHYETFIKLMIFAYELVYESKPFEEERFKQLSKKDFYLILQLTEKIPDFEVFRVPYNNKLRNHLVHPSFKIDYTNKMVIYSSTRISFKDVLTQTRNLLEVLASNNFIYVFISRKKIQEAYYLLQVEKNEHKKQNLMK